MEMKNGNGIIQNGNLFRLEELKRDFKVGVK